MDVVELLPRLRLLRFPVGQAYLWTDDEELTPVDADPKGCGTAIADVVRAVGRDPSEVRRIVLTHFHDDHMSAASELTALRRGARHPLDPPVVRGAVPGTPPVFEEWELPLHAEAVRHLPAGGPVRPARVVEVSDGDVLDFGGGARVVHAPGHTHGSVGIHLPEHGVLFTGDAVASSPVHGVLLGVFDVDRAAAVRSFHRLAGLPADVACSGHGDPVIGRAGAALRESADRHEATP
ncbi:MBL fold metallo-hydrolase [Streptomyces sp. NPDC001848]|uniref:MBL fold metallo-hydrolase n=1 Tax=Streptomyces sp. NPDC001848 TaxID=3364618 RepID=UPI003691FFD0